MLFYDKNYYGVNKMEIGEVKAYFRDMGINRIKFTKKVLQFGN